MVFVELAIADLVEIRPKMLHDARGYFSEIFRKDRFRDVVGTCDIVQENQSMSLAAGTIRGIHFQAPPVAQGKLVRCIRGRIFDVAVDLRRGSPTFGKWAAIELSADAANQLWIPPGFGHAFCTLEPECVVGYGVTAYYSAEHDKGLGWDDPTIGIEWPPIADADTLSAKDRGQPSLAKLPDHFTVEG